MSNLWINIQFGERYLQIGRDGISFRKNYYVLIGEVPRRLFIFQFFSYNAEPKDMELDK